LKSAKHLAAVLLTLKMGSLTKTAAVSIATAAGGGDRQFSVSHHETAWNNTMHLANRAPQSTEYTIKTAS
jgi:hypothetical protein